MGILDLLKIPISKVTSGEIPAYKSFNTVPVKIQQAEPLKLPEGPKSSLAMLSQPISSVIPIQKGQNAPLKSLVPKVPVSNRLGFMNAPIASVVPDIVVRKQDWKDVGNLPFELGVKPLMGLGSLFESITGKKVPFGLDKIEATFPHYQTVTDGDYTHQVPVEEPAMTSRVYYEDLVSKGSTPDEAFKQTALKTVLDMAVLAPILKGLGGSLLRKTVPESLINSEIISAKRAEIRDFLSGAPEYQGRPSPIPKEIEEAFKRATYEQKSAMIKATGIDVVKAKPSMLGKMFGVSEEEAQTIIERMTGAKGGMREGSAGALPGYKMDPQAGAINPKGKPVGFGVEKFTPQDIKNAIETKGVRPTVGDIITDSSGKKLEVVSVMDDTTGATNVTNGKMEIGTRLASDTKGLVRTIEVNQILPSSQKTTGADKTGTEIQPDLVQEARKYKSAEEFVKAKGEPLFTGGTKGITEFRLPEGDGVDTLMYGKGIYLTPDKNLASAYGSKGGETYEVFADIKKPLTPRSKDWQQFIQKSNGEQKRNYLIKNGYDAVVDTTGKYKQVMVVNPEQIKTKSQLTDIWEKAQSPTLLEGSEKIDQAKGLEVGVPSKSSVAISLPSTRSQELFTNLKASKPESVSTILKISPSNFTKRSFIQSYLNSIDEISQETLPAYKALIKEATGLEPHVRVKAKDSAEGKIERYLLNKKDPNEIADNLGARIIVKEEKDIPTQIDNIQKNLDVVEVQNYFDSPTDFGYKGVNIKVRLPNGLLAEVQIHTQESLKKGGQIHKLYEKWRNLDLSNITPEQKTQYLKDKDTSRAIATASRVNTKLEKQVSEARSFEEFYERSGIDRASLDATAQKKGYRDALDFYDKHKTSLSEDGSFELMSKEQTGSEFALRRSRNEEERVVSNLESIFADLKGVSIGDLKVKFSEDELAQAELDYQWAVESLIDHPGRALVRFRSTKEGEFLDFKDPKFAKTESERKAIIERTAKIKTVAEKALEGKTYLGSFDDEDTIKKLINEYLDRKKQATEFLDNLKEIRNNIRLAKQAENFIGKEKNKLAREVAKNLRGMRDLVQAARLSGFRKGLQVGSKKYNTIVQQLKSRRSKITAIQNALNLTDAEMWKARGKKDPRFLTDKEFEGYLEGVRKGAELIHETNKERLLVETIIQERNLKKTENLQKALELPQLKNMNLKQLVEFGDILAKTEYDDTFLGPRMIQTAVNTDLGNIRTIGEGIQAIAKQTGMPFEGAVEGSKLDRWLRDPALVEKDPLHKFFITEWVAKEADMLTREHALKQELNKLAGAARKSRRAKSSIKAKIGNIIAPQDDLVVKWLQPFEVTWTEDGKKIINRLPELRERAEAAMTYEEITYARFLEKFFSHYYNLAQQEAMARWTLKGVKHTNYKQIYFTHMNRPFFERLRDDGLVKALKMAWGKNVAETKVDFNAFGDRGEVLGMEKWLNRAMTREGEGIDKITGQVLYTQNTAKVALAYFHAFERKLNIDAMVPKIKLLEFIMGKRLQTPKSINNPEGSEKVHSVLRKHINEWINNKKGQRIEMVYAQGDRMEAVVDTASMVVTLLDLGGNLTTQVGSSLGGYIFTAEALGLRKYITKGIPRALTKQGRAIARKNAGVIGENPWFELASVANDLGDTLRGGLFSIFGDLGYRAKRQMFLGLLTQEEFKTGQITAKRLAEIKLEIGKYHSMPEFRSVAGSTSIVKAAAKYTEWATPHFQKSMQDIGGLINEAKRLSGKPEDLKRFYQSKGFRNTMYSVIFGLGAYAIGQMIFNPDEADRDTFMGRLRYTAARDMSSILQAMTGVGVFVGGRMLGFMQDLKNAGVLLLTLERYKENGPGYNEGDLKAINALQKTLTPKLIQQFLPPPETSIKTLEELKKETLEKIESGKMTVSATKEYFKKELESIKTKEKNKRFKLSNKEYKADLLKRLESKDISVEDAKKEFAEYIKTQKEYAPESFESSSDAGFIKKIQIAAKAIRTDPVTLFQAIFTGEEIRRMDNGEIILHRGKTSDDLGQKEFSEKKRKEFGATSALILDHTIPLELGGSNADSNLKLVLKEDWESFTPVENYLGQALRENNIRAEKAQELIRAFKNGEMSADEVYQSVRK